MLRRTCNPAYLCYDGWPYTQNDGYLGQASQGLGPAASTSDAKTVKAATTYFAGNKAGWDASYGEPSALLEHQGLHRLFRHLTEPAECTAMA